MALRLYPSADERVDVVCTTDPAIARENGEVALARYRGDGDISALSVPADATRVTIAPLTASATAQAARDAGLPPRTALAARERLAGRETSDDLTDEDVEALVALAAWSDAHALALLRYGVKRIPDVGDVALVRRGALECYPDAVLERIDIASRRELAAHVARISHLGHEGKAS